jgi:hypothetical protein
VPAIGGNVFLTDRDASTPLLEDGSRIVTCKPITTLAGGKLAGQGLRLMLRLAQYTGL